MAKKPMVHLLLLVSLIVIAGCKTTACCEKPDGSCISVSGGADGRRACQAAGGIHKPNQKCTQFCDPVTVRPEMACCFFEQTQRCASVPNNNEGRRTCTADRGTFDPMAVCKSKCQ